MKTQEDIQSSGYTTRTLDIFSEVKLGKKLGVIPTTTTTKIKSITNFPPSLALEVVKILRLFASGSCRGGEGWERG